MARRRGPLATAILVGLLATPVPERAPAEPLPSVERAAGTLATTHHVQIGETLSAIAAIHLGNPHLWPAIYRANRDQIRDPERLYPGQTLAIPETPATAVRGRPRTRGDEVEARSAP